MNLKDFLASRDRPPDLYWSLVIEEGWVQAGIWYIGASAAETLAVSPPAAWEIDSELTGAADAALSSCVQKLPENYPEPDKTVFGVPSGWVKGGEITEEYLAKIKKICTDLSLTPVGFVVLPEAIAHLYKSEEEVPLNAIIVGLGSESLEVSVFKLGNLTGTTQVARSVSLTDDVSEGLSRFEGASPLPSRFIVFDGKGGELNDAKEELIRASWEEKGKFKFLHSPKAEVLSSERKVLATSLAGANEIGHVSQISSKEGQEEMPLEEVENISVPEEKISAQELGFSVGEDISVKSTAPAPDIKPVEAPAVAGAPFVQKFDVGNYLQKTKSLYHSLSGKLFPKKAMAPPMGKKPFITLGIAALIILVAAGLFWWFYPKAKITIYVSPKNFEQEVQLKFSTSGKSDVAAGIIPGKTLTAEVNGDKTKATTGTKLVGDEAKGTVQIANGSPVSIDLPPGTVFTSSGGLKFVLNSEASVSGQILPGSPGTANVDITASDIGSQYNLAKGEVFSVGNYLKAQVAATSQGDFSGGSSQEISAVSAGDQASLEKDLKGELAQNAKQELTSKTSDGQVFVNDLAALDIKSENFDHQVGDQADNLKLSLDIEATGIAADKSKLLDYARGILKDKIPSGYALRDSQINLNFTFVDNKGGTFNYKAVVSANFLPQINSEDIIRKISGKTTDVAESYLTSIPGFTRAGVTLSPRLPGFLGTLPRVRGNITLDVVAEQ